MKMCTSLLILFISVSVHAATTKAPTPTPTPVPQIQPATKPPVIDTIIFSGDEPEQVGKLTWKNGRFEFTGKADKSAQVFFNRYLKDIVDAYLKEKGCPGK